MCSLEAWPRTRKLLCASAKGRAGGGGVAGAGGTGGGVELGGGGAGCWGLGADGRTTTERGVERVTEEKRTELALSFLSLEDRRWARRARETPLHAQSVRRPRRCEPRPAQHLLKRRVRAPWQVCRLKVLDRSPASRCAAAPFPPTNTASRRLLPCTCSRAQFLTAALALVAGLAHREQGSDSVAGQRLWQVLRGRRVHLPQDQAAERLVVSRVGHPLLARWRVLAG